MPCLKKLKKLILMQSKITKNIDGSWDISEVKSINDLSKEISQLKREIKVGTEQVKENTKQLPRQAFNATVGKALPFLSTDNNDSTDTNNRGNGLLSIASNPKTLGIAGGVASMIISAITRKKRRKETLKTRINDTARTVATSAALQGGMFLLNVLSSWNQRRQARKQVDQARVKREVLKLLEDERRLSRRS